MDYSYFQKDYILREEILHFACTAYNMIHPDRRIEIPARYQRPQYDMPSTEDTPEPMADEPPVPPEGHDARLLEMGARLRTRATKLRISPRVRTARLARAV